MLDTVRQVDKIIEEKRKQSNKKLIFTGSAYEKQNLTAAIDKKQNEIEFYFKEGLLTRETEMGDESEDETKLKKEF